VYIGALLLASAYVQISDLSFGYDIPLVSIFATQFITFFRRYGKL